MIIEYKSKNKIFFVDVACLRENNIDTKNADKQQKYQQLAFETRKRQPGYNVMIILIAIGSLGGGMRRMTNQSGRLTSNKKKTRATSNKMVKTVLFESEIIARKVLPRLIQEE